MVASATAALDMAKTVLGKTEGRDRVALIDYMKTGGQNIDPATRAWCASFINASLQQAGYSGTGSDLARSFLQWGEAVDPTGVKPGDIGVYPRGNDPMYGHAGIVESVDPKTGMVTMVSGNTEGGAGGEDQVGRGQYSLKGALGFRRAAEQMKAAGYSDEQIKSALLSTIAGTESPGYDVMYGGKKFTDFSQHPNVRVPIGSGPNQGRFSTAAGRYQFIKGTWDEQAAKLGLKDFSPTSQDAAAWNLAEETYKAKTGGNLIEALQSGDPGRMNAAAQILSSQWTSLPGGIEQAKGYGSGTFAESFNKYLNAAGGQSVHPPQATVGTTGDAAKPAVAATTDKTKPKDKYAAAAMAGMKGLGALPAPKMGAGGNAPQLPAMAPMALDAVPMVANDVGARRDQLAMLMQKLNAGQLW